MSAWIIGIMVFAIAWFGLFIWLWVKGTNERNGAMTIVGGLFSLGIIGLIISIVQVTTWDNNANYRRVEHHYYTNQEQAPGNSVNTEEEKLKQAFLDGILTRQEYEKKRGDL